MFTNNQFSIVEPMEDIVVRRVDGKPIRIRDLGRVEDSAETQQSIVRVNGERAVYMRVNKQPGANTVEVVDAVKRTLPTLLGVPSGVQVNLTFDQSTYIRQSIQSLWHEATVGCILAFLVILIFLRSFVSTVIISIAIPLSLLLTLVAMYMLGQTLNIFTLGGLALAVGRLVDDSIVELENINRHLNMPGNPRRRAVLDAAREVAMPIFVSTITTIVVFLPTVFLEGQAKLLFIPLTFTISCSLFASFLVSRTVTPLLCLHWLKPEAPSARRNLYTRTARVERPRAGQAGRGLPAVARVGAGASQDADRRDPGPRPQRGGPAALHRNRVLPALRREPVHHPRARACGHAGGGDGAHRGQDGGHHQDHAQAG